MVLPGNFHGAPNITIRVEPVLVADDVCWIMGVLVNVLVGECMLRFSVML